jgi:hypothetical protein
MIVSSMCRGICGEGAAASEPEFREGG